MTTLVHILDLAGIPTHNDSMIYITSFYRNEGYIVEDLGLMSAIAHENVVLGE